MRETVSPAALSKALSLQRANARAKSNSRSELGISDQKLDGSGGQLSKCEAEVVFTGTDALDTSCPVNYIKQSRADVPDQPGPCVNKGGDDTLQLISHVIKRSLSALDIPGHGCMDCFSSLSERIIHKSMDIWDHDTSLAMSICASDASFHHGMQSSTTRPDSGSSTVCAPTIKEDLSNKSCSWSESDSVVDDDIHITEEESDQGSSFNSRIMQGINGIDHPDYSQHTAAPATDHALTVQDDGTRCRSLQGESCEAGAEAAGYISSLDEYLITRDGPRKTSGATCQSISAEEGHGNSEEERLRVRCRGDYERLKEEILGKEAGNGNSESLEEEEVVMMTSRNRDSMWGCRKMRVDVLPTAGEEDECGHGRDVKMWPQKKERGRGGGEADVVIRVPPDSVAVEVVSVNMVADFKESMQAMIVESWCAHQELDDTSMQDLLDCYLLLNPSQLHGIIREVFSDVWIDILMAVR